MSANVEYALADYLLMRPLDEWTEADGDALWWFFPVVEPPYCGCPLDDDFPPYVTHWSLIPRVWEPEVRE